MTAQNQHYVPRFILRHFLANEKKEQVAVYDKSLDRTFNTSIKNIMAERRFHDFSFEENIISFESVISRIEDYILPAYTKIVENRRLDNTGREKVSLAYLIAFQFMRTKSHRNLSQDLEGELRKKIEEMGGRMEDLEGWAPLTEDELKKDHFRDLQKNIRGYAKIIASKHLFLAEAADGRSFYLGDHPVCLNNQRDFGPYGNIGLAVPGIEIYLPLASDLMLCAWCPTILPKMVEDLASIKISHQRELLSEVFAGRITASVMKESLERMKPHYLPMEQLESAFKEGRPINSNADNMDYYNSLQMRYASRYVVSKEADFELAKRHNKQFPHLRNGPRITLG